MTDHNLESRRTQILKLLSGGGSRRAWLADLCLQGAAASYPEPVVGPAVAADFLRDVCLLHICLPDGDFGGDLDSRLGRLVDAYSRQQSAAATRKFLFEIRAPISTQISPLFDKTDYSECAQRIREWFNGLDTVEQRFVSWLHRRHTADANYLAGSPISNTTATSAFARFRAELGFDGEFKDATLSERRRAEPASPTQPRGSDQAGMYDPVSLFVDIHRRIGPEAARTLLDTRYPFALDERARDCSAEETLFPGGNPPVELLHSLTARLPNLAHSTERTPCAAALDAARTLMRRTSSSKNGPAPAASYTVRPLRTLEDLGLLLRQRRQLFRERFALGKESRWTETESILRMQGHAADTVQVAKTKEGMALGFLVALPLTPQAKASYPSGASRYEFVDGAGWLAQPGESSAVFLLNYLNLVEGSPVGARAHRALAASFMEFAAKYLRPDARPWHVVAGGSDNNGQGVMLSAHMKRELERTLAGWVYFTKSFTDDEMGLLDRIRPHRSADAGEQSHGG